MLLLRGGILYTMAPGGPVEGDVLAEGGRILRVGQRIDAPDLPGEAIIDARGLRICPGFIDVHMHLAQTGPDAPKRESDLITEALTCGVTSHALWPREPGLIRLGHGHDPAEAREPMRWVRHEAFTDGQLREEMAQLRAQGQRMAVEVYGEEALNRLIRLGGETGCALVLTHLTGCRERAEDIARTGWEVILGACALRTGGDHTLAARLERLGVPLALTSDYPATRLHHLPLSAGLCVRAGMEPVAALAAITRGAAKLLRLEDQCGAIRPGLRADFTLFDGDPMMLSSARVMTISAGRVVQRG